MATHTVIASTVDVEALARGLLDPERDRPWAVVTIPQGRTAPLISVEEFERGVGQLCRLFLLPTGELSWRLGSLLPERCQVYGGAARVYPVGAGWAQDPSLSPLRFVWGDPDAVTDALIGDALGMANAAGLLTSTLRPMVAAAGTVAVVVSAKRALVHLDTGGLAVIAQESVCPGVPLDWVVESGQHFVGSLDEETKWFTPEWAGLTELGALEAYPPGTVTLGFVGSVERQSATILLHPALSVSVSRSDVSSNRFDRVDLLLAAGDVVAVRTALDPHGRLRLDLSDIDDDEPVAPAVSLVESGGPWLVEGRNVEPDGQDESLPPVRDRQPAESFAGPAGDDEAPPLREDFPAAVVKPGPGPRPAGRVAVEPAPQATIIQSMQLTIDSLRARIRELESRTPASGRVPHDTVLLELGQLHDVVTRLRRELTEAQKSAREQRQLLRRRSRGEPASPFGDRRSKFDAAEEWVRHEVLLAWVDRFDPATRRVRPLPESYLVGGGFPDSLSTLDDGQLSKAFKAVVDVLTGQLRDVAAARRPHPLRTGNGAEDKDVVRAADAARCMRVSIESNVASARRLHYWVLADGGIELSRIVLHDDMNP